MNVATNGTKPTQVISFEELCDLLEVAKVVEETNLGNTLIKKAIHPTRGNIILVNTAGDKNAIMYV